MREFWQYFSTVLKEYEDEVLRENVLQEIYAFSCSQLLSTALALIALMVFAYFTMGCKPRKSFLVVSLLWISSVIPVLFFQNIIIEELLSSVYGGVGVILLKFAFPKLRVPHLLFVYAFLLGFSSISYALVTSVTYPMTSNDFSIILPTVLMAICVIPWVILFVVKTRHRIREMIAATPSKTLIISGVLLLIMYYLNLILAPYGFFSLLIHNLVIDAYYNAELKAWPQYYNTPEALEELEVNVDSYVTWLEYVWQAIYTFFLQLSLCVFVPIMMVFSSSNSRLKKQNADFEKQIEAQAAHYRNLAEANTEVRRFRHDFKNLRFALEKLLAEGKKTEAQAVMQEFSEALDSSKRFVMLFDTGNGIADALLTDKLYRAKEKDTLISFEGAIPHSALLPTDLCVLLGNTIDNAIEACEKLPEEFERSITVECNCSSGFLFLTIRNPIHKPVDIVDNRVNTTKKDNALHGFGISSLHKVAKKYDGTVKLDAEGGYFTVNVDLCLPAQALAS